MVLQVVVSPDGVFTFQAKRKADAAGGWIQFCKRHGGIRTTAWQRLVPCSQPDVCARLRRIRILYHSQKESLKSHGQKISSPSLDGVVYGHPQPKSNPGTRIRERWWMRIR